MPSGKQKYFNIHECLNIHTSKLSFKSHQPKLSQLATTY